MLSVIYLAMLACVALAAIALTPQPEGRMPKLPAPRVVPLVAPKARMAHGQGPVLTWLLPLLAPLGKLIPLSSKDQEALTNRLRYLGSAFTPTTFRGLKMLSMGAGVFVASTILLEVGRMDPLWGIAGAGLGFLAPDFWLRSRLAKRNKAIIRLLPEVIDLLSLCIGAGLDFLGALNRVVTARAYQTKKKEPLVEELSVVLQEVKLGKRRFEAFKTMAQRVNLPEISSFVRAIVQADRMGTPIGEVLAVHSEDVRLQRFMRAERVALRAPIKILVPLIFFIMPCVAIIVAGPIFIQFARQNPFQMLNK